MKTVEVHVTTSKGVGDSEQLKVVENEYSAERWFPENDPEGPAFEYGAPTGGRTT